MDWVIQIGLVELAIDGRPRAIVLAGCMHGRRIAEAALVFCERAGIEDWPALQQSHVRTFAARSFANGLLPSSVQRRLSAVRTFLAFLERERHIECATRIEKGGRDDRPVEHELHAATRLHREGWNLPGELKLRLARVRGW